MTMQTRKAAEQTKQVEKNMNQSGKSNPRCKMGEQKRGWGNGSLLHLNIFNSKENCEKPGNKKKNQEKGKKKKEWKKE